MLDIIFPVYNPREGNLEHHINAWRNYSDAVRKDVKFILVDDYSDVPIKLEIDFPVNLIIARIKTDCGWNINGAKNLGASLSKSEWIFNTDVDHIFTTEDDLKRTIDMEKKKGEVYLFHRLNEEGKFRGSNHCNTFLFNRDDFWKIGGYDEDTAGRYGYNDLLLNYMVDKNYKRVQTDINITEFMSAAMVMDKRRENIEQYEADLLHNEKIVRKKMREVDMGTYKPGKILRFEWEIIQEENF